MSCEIDTGSQRVAICLLRFVLPPGLPCEYQTEHEVPERVARPDCFHACVFGVVLSSLLLGEQECEVGVEPRVPGTDGSEVELFRFPFPARVLGN